MLISFMDGSLVWSTQYHQSGTSMPLGAVHPTIVRSEATKQSIVSLRPNGLLRFARNDVCVNKTPGLAGEKAPLEMSTTELAMSDDLRSLAEQSNAWPFE